jgi:hypothetical protein
MIGLLETRAGLTVADDKSMARTLARILCVRRNLLPPDARPLDTAASTSLVKPCYLAITMDSKFNGSGVFAPGASFDGAASLPGRDTFPAPEAAPKLDEHIVKPETREEMVRGQRIHAMPSLPPHGDQHFRLDYIIGAHLRPEYIGSTDMLTRSSVTSDFATDTCVRKSGINPATNERYLEEVAFEVVYEQTWRDITDRAEDLTKRGVRRVFAIFVKKRQVCEWSREGNRWVDVRPDEPIEDPCFASPLTVNALLDAAEADDSVARALLRKKNPVLEEVRKKEREQSLKKGLKKGRKEGVRVGVLQTEQRIILVIVEKTLERTLTDKERATILKLHQRLGFERLHDECHTRRGVVLAKWLTDPIPD